MRMRTPRTQKKIRQLIRINLGGFMDVEGTVARYFRPLAFSLKSTPYRPPINRLKPFRIWFPIRRDIAAKVAKIGFRGAIDPRHHMRNGFRQ
jgi:hypothetical protein